MGSSTTTWVRKFLFSWNYFAFLLLILALNTFLLVWYSVEHTRGVWYVALEIFSLVLLLVEIILRVLEAGGIQKYFECNCIGLTNLIDLLLFLLCLFAMVIQMRHVKTILGGDSNTSNLVLLAVRYVARVLIFCHIFYRSQHSARVVKSAHGKVNFDKATVSFLDPDKSYLQSRDYRIFPDDDGALLQDNAPMHDNSFLHPDELITTV